MSRRKRPKIIKTIKVSTPIVFHIGMAGLYVENRGELAPGVERTTRILTGDLKNE